MWYQHIEDKLQGNNLVGANLIGSLASLQLNWNSNTVAVNNVDIVGGVIQYWLSIWFDNENIPYRANPQTQQWPDFEIETIDMHGTIIFMPLEVKAFKKGASPAFDISDFNLYITSITSNPKKIDCDYLVFEYEILSTGIQLTRYWWKKVWELVGNKKNTRLVTLQTRKRSGITLPNNLRPFKFFSLTPRNIRITSRFEYVQLLHTTCLHYDNQHIVNWCTDIQQRYLSQTGQPL